MSLALLSSFLVVLATGCGGGTGTAPPASEGQATVGTAGATVTGPDGVLVELPAGALSSVATVRIARDSEGAPVLEDHLVTLTPVYSVTPHIPVLGVPATVSLPIDTSKLDPNAPPPVVMVASPGGDWEVLPTEPVQGGVIKAHTAHFSYIVAVQIPAGFVTAEVVLPDALKPPPGYPDKPIFIKARQAFTGTVNLKVPSKAFDQTTGNWYCRTPMTISINLIFRDRSGQVVRLVPKTLGPFTSAANAAYTFSIDDSLNGYAQLQLIQNCQLTFPPNSGVHGFAGGLVIWGAANFDVDIPPPVGAPVIAFQPEAASVLVGDPASFNVTASASGQLQGSWFRSNDGGNTWVDTGASGTVLNLPATSLADDGALFRVKLCNIDGGKQVCIDSAPAALHVASAFVAPKVVISNSSLNSVVGQTASITAIATGAPAPRLAIYRVGNSTPVQDCHATSPCTYTKSSLTLSDDGAQFYAQAVTPGHTASEAGFSATTSVYTLHVAVHFAAPGITTPPQSFRSTVGGKATFNVQAGGTSALSYRWLLNGVPLADHPAGATTSGVAGSSSSALTLSNVQAADAGNYSVEVSNGTLPNATSAAASLTLGRVVAMAAGGSHTCASHADGSVTCAGLNDNGQLGDGTRVSRTTPTLVQGGNFSAILATGGRHTCAVGLGGDLYCWGSNEHGQLGEGSTIDKLNPAKVPGLNDISALTAGDSHTCALKYDGSVWCWGSNAYGQLGIGAGNSSDVLVPTVVPGLHAIALGSGSGHTCAVRSDFAVVCWGRNQLAQLGDGSTVDKAEPTVVPGLAGMAFVLPGLNHTCAASIGGTVMCWGSNRFGQFGNGVMVADPIATPTLVTGLTGVRSGAAGSFHTCVARGRGEPPMPGGYVACWGDNSNGQLGDSGSGTSPNALFVNEGVNTVTAGQGHTCAVMSDGSASCWGLNNHGQLGDGTTVDKNSPTRVPF